MDDAGDVDKNRELATLLTQGVLALILCLALALVLGLWLREPAELLANQTVAHFGVPGILVGVVASDAFGAPIPPSAYIFGAIAARIPMLSLLAAIIATSIISASLAYLLGPYLARLPLLRQLFERFKPHGEALFARWGIWTVGIAALTPLPFSLICWLAGIYRMRYAHFAAITLIRGPRILVYYGIIWLGWSGFQI